MRDAGKKWYRSPQNENYELNWKMGRKMNAEQKTAMTREEDDNQLERWMLDSPTDELTETDATTNVQMPTTTTRILFIACMVQTYICTI